MAGVVVPVEQPIEKTPTPEEDAADDEREDWEEEKAQDIHVFTPAK